MNFYKPSRPSPYSINFPVMFFIVELLKTSDDEATEILISGGTGFG